MARIKVFISYAHDDDRWRKRLVSHLGVLDQGFIDVWDDRVLGPGDDWFARIHEQMSNARIAVLLVSSAFLTSTFIRTQEVPRLFVRHEAEGMRIYPLLIRSCPWEEVSWLARMQIRPPDAKPVSRNRGDKVDQVLTEVVREIAGIVRAFETVKQDDQATRGLVAVPDIPAANRPTWSQEVHIVDLSARWRGLDGFFYLIDQQGDQITWSEHDSIGRLTSTGKGKITG